jgi:hypothetical protein
MLNNSWGRLLVDHKLSWLIVCVNEWLAGMGEIAERQHQQKKRYDLRSKYRQFNTKSVNQEKVPFKF